MFVKNMSLTGLRPEIASI